MLVQEHWNIDIALFWNYLMLITRTHFGPAVILKSFWQTRKKRIKSQCIVSDTDKHSKFDLEKKLNPWLKFEPNLLTWLPHGKMEKPTVYQPFSLFVQFSAIEIRLVFSHAKLMISE